MNIKQALSFAKTQLTHDTALRDSELLLSHTLDCAISFLYAYPEKPLSDQQQQTFAHFIQHRKTGYPVAYLMGKWDSYALTLSVNQDVLIPRPETDCVIETCLQLLDHNQPCRILDLGTGSGTIALNLAYACPDWQITAVDQSLTALNIAKYNGEQHQLTNMIYTQSNWFDALTPEPTFHLIVSNPPYVAPDDPHLKGDIRFEPHAALVSKQNGLADLSMIITAASDYLLPNGWLVLEHGESQADKVRNYLSHNGFCNIQTQPDLSGLPRFTQARRST